MNDQPPQTVEWELVPPEAKRRPVTLEPLFRFVAIIMDGLLRLPGTKRRLGLNPVVDFIPVVGDVSAALVSASVLVYGFTRGLPKVLLARMALNVALNELIGVVPVVGSVFAFWFRANKRNYDLLQQHLIEPHRSRKGDWAFVIGIFSIVAAIIVFSWVATAALLYWLAKGIAA